MKNFWIGKNRRISYKLVVYLCVLAMLSVMMFLFVSYKYYDYQSQSREAAVREAENVANRVVTQVDERFMNLQRYYQSVANYDSIRWILENDLTYADYSRYKAAQDIFDCRTIFGDYISEFTFVNYKTNWVLSNKGMFRMDETVNGDVLRTFFDDKIHGEKNFWTYDHSILIENTIDREYRVTVETGGLNLVLRLPSTSYNTYALLMVNVNMQTWMKWITELTNETETVVVLSQDGELIYAADPGAEDACRALQQQENHDMTTREREINGKKYTVAAETSSVLGWNYYILYDAPVEEGGTGLSVAMIMLLMLSCGICFVAVSYILYHPIKSLMKEITDDGQKVVGNELDFLAGSYQNLKNDKQVLENLMYQQQDKLQELFELRLIHGDVSHDEWEDYLSGFKLRSFQHFATVILVLNLTDEEGTQNQSTISEDVICLKTVQEMPKELKEMAWMPPVYNACTIFAIFAEDDEEALLDKIMQFHSGMQEFTEKSYGFRVLMGVSATHTSFYHMRAAYRESINALTFKAAANETSETTDCYFYLNSTAARGNSYDGRFEQDIQAAIKGVDKSRCYDVTDDFCRYLTELSGDQEAVSIYLLRYANTILLTAMEAKLDFNQLFPDGIKKMYRELLEAVEPDRERRYIKRYIIDPILEMRREFLEDNSYSMIEEIEKLIAQKNGDISLTECAETLGVHHTYIWKALKMESDKSFSDYIEEYKIKEAKRLLLHTNMTVAEIAEKLGYTNAQNFIRFFSKNTGITPGKFRKLS